MQIKRIFLFYSIGDKNEKLMYYINYNKIWTIKNPLDFFHEVYKSASSLRYSFLIFSVIFLWIEYILTNFFVIVLKVLLLYII